MNDIYNCKTGYSKTFEHILGSETLVKEYVVCERGRKKLSRGHLTANADLPYYPIRMTTFKYMNAAPQWATVNSANWNYLETRTRELVKSYTNGLLVYTGTHGVTTLPDETPIYRDLYLYYNSEYKIRVPEFYWRVVYDPETKKGTAIVGINNPYLESIVPLCPDVCSEITWLITKNFKPGKQEFGYMYCCEVEELSKIVEEIPKLEVDGLLI
ncbi:UNVERIFIED_CONTAM: hypothetical protein B566_EDAN018822 [Ephemera danica]|nr:hypothetical protein B566_EDAN018822 [Ephemera danica]